MGVPGLLADPVLRVFRQHEAMPLHHNDDRDDIAAQTTGVAPVEVYEVD